MTDCYLHKVTRVQSAVAGRLVIRASLLLHGLTDWSWTTVLFQVDVFRGQMRKNQPCTDIWRHSYWIRSCRGNLISILGYALSLCYSVEIGRMSRTSCVINWSQHCH